MVASIAAIAKEQFGLGASAISSDLLDHATLPVPTASEILVSRLDHQLPAFHPFLIVGDVTDLTPCIRSAISSLLCFAFRRPPSPDWIENVKTHIVAFTPTPLAHLALQAAPLVPHHRPPQFRLHIQTRRVTGPPALVTRDHLFRHPIPILHFVADAKGAERVFGGRGGCSGFRFTLALCFCRGGSAC